MGGIHLAMGPLHLASAPGHREVPILPDPGALLEGGVSESRGLASARSQATPPGDGEPAAGRS